MGGANGPMGKEAVEIGAEPGARVTIVAGAPEGPLLAAGLEDGRVWTAELTGSGQTKLKADKGAPVTALALSRNANRLAWGDEDGAAGVFDLA
jgi:hypothetical protein